MGRSKLELEFKSFKEAFHEDMVNRLKDIPHSSSFPRNRTIKSQGRINFMNHEISRKVAIKINEAKKEETGGCK